MGVGEPREGEASSERISWVSRVYLAGPCPMFPRQSSTVHTVTSVSLFSVAMFSGVWASSLLLLKDIPFANDNKSLVYIIAVSLYCSLLSSKVYPKVKTGEEETERNQINLELN